MQLEKNTSNQEDPINFYDELFSKKSSEQPTVLENQPKTEDQPEQHIDNIKNNKLENTDHNVSKTTVADKFSGFSFMEKFKNKSKKMNLKYLVTGLLVGVIVNISVSHYQDMNLQHTSQKFATGLMYNLSETNDLEQIAKNIYLGMKDNGWEPKVKLSNSNIFVFELEKGGEFTITKNQDINSTKFHIEVSDFSTTMIKALMIQLEPTKIGGTKNFITNKKYDAAQDKVSFDLEKLGQGLLPTVEGPLLMPSAIPGYPPLSKNEINLPPLVTIPISPELDGVLNKDNKNIENEILLKQIQNTNQMMDNYINKNTSELKK